MLTNTTCEVWNWRQLDDGFNLFREATLGESSAAVALSLPRALTSPRRLTSSGSLTQPEAVAATA